jgi:hypothetical protein
MERERSMILEGDRIQRVNLKKTMRGRGREREREKENMRLEVMCTSLLYLGR